MSTRTTGKRENYDQMDLATRMAEREWKHSQKSPNIPMPVKAEIRAELQRVAEQIRKLRRDDRKDPKRSQSTERTYSEGLTEALALIRKATR